MINVSMLQDELQNFVSAASDVQGAALVSPDGLALGSVLPGGMDEERTAAMSASMLSVVVVAVPGLSVSVVVSFGSVLVGSDGSSVVVISVVVVSEGVCGTTS